MHPSIAENIIPLYLSIKQSAGRWQTKSGVSDYFFYATIIIAFSHVAVQPSRRTLAAVLSLLWLASSAPLVFIFIDPGAVETLLYKFPARGAGRTVLKRCRGVLVSMIGILTSCLSIKFKSGGTQSAGYQGQK